MLIPMKRMTLVALKDDEAAIMKALQGIGVVQVIKGENAKETQDASKLEALCARFTAARDIVKPYAKKPSLLSAKPEATADELISSIPGGLELSAKIEDIDRDINRLKNEIAKHKSTIDLLEPFEGLTAPIEAVRPTRSVRYQVGFLAPEKLEMLEAAGIAYEAFISGGDEKIKRDAAVIAAYSASDAENAVAALKEADFQEHSLPKLTGTPKANMQRLAGEIASLEAEKKALEDELPELAKKKELLEKSCDAARIEKTLAENTALIDTTDAAFILEGWVCSGDVEKADKTIAGVTSAYFTDYRDPLEDETPPSVVKNTKFNTPFESVQNMYSRPAYNGVDSVAGMTLFYILFFAMMLSDTGYGLVLFLGCLLYEKLVKPKGNFASTVKVIKYCGLATVFVGFAIGTFFGMNWPEIFGAGSIFPFIDPIQNIMTMIFICCGLGIVHMMYGICIKIGMCIKEKDYAGAIFDNLAWILIVLGLVAILASSFIGVPMVSTIGAVAAGIGAVLVLFFKGRDKKNPLKRIISGLGGLYGVSSYLGDTLSYVRILALGLVTGAMGQVFNMIGAMIFNALAGLGFVGAILGVVFAGALLAALHGFSLFINTLGTYVHCARLQYVEYYGKFYEANGVEFKPLTYDVTKHVNVK